MTEVVAVDDVATAFADLVVRERPRTIALSGGGTARRCYEALAARSGIDWPSVVVLFGDERMVPVTSPDSNEGMAREELLDHVPVGAVHSMATSTADQYDALVASLGTIDLVHLGLGPDGHSA
jgi:6-phosphogluconolactonase